MALPTATTEAITVKKAVCPGAGCSAERYYYLDSGSKPIPLNNPLSVERDEAQASQDESQSTSCTFNTLSDTTMSWTEDEFVGHILEILRESGGRAKQKRVVPSNTSDTLTISGKFHNEYRSLVY